jgi:hypothetical protein
VIRTGRQTQLRADRNRFLNQVSTDPDATHPECAFPFYPTRTAYSKTHPEATRSVLWFAWCHTNTIIPNPYNPLDWNRYQYVDSNPVNLTDPSGNFACEKQEETDECDPITDDDIKDVINWTFGWTTKGDFTRKDLQKIIDAGNEISDKVTSITHHWGTGWIRSNIGNAVFEQDGWSNWFTTNVVGRPAATLLTTILLQTVSWNVYTLIHELGHVLDDNTRTPGSAAGPADIFGGGAADKMVTDMGGNPTLCVPRFSCSGYSDPRISGFYPWPNGAYGSKGVAEDFAETFVNTIVNESLVPSGRLDWMKKNISW